MEKIYNRGLRNFIADASEGMTEGDIRCRDIVGTDCVELEVCLSEDTSAFLYMTSLALSDGSTQNIMFGRVMENGAESLVKALSDRGAAANMKRLWPKFYKAAMCGVRDKYSGAAVCGLNGDVIMATAISMDRIGEDSGMDYFADKAAFLVANYITVRKEMEGDGSASGESPWKSASRAVADGYIRGRRIYNILRLMNSLFT